MKLPEEFLKRMKALLSGEYEAFLASFEEPRRYGLRVNTLKAAAEEFEKNAPFPVEKLPWIPGGYCYTERGASRHPLYYAGLYYLQEPSAMTPANVLPVRPGDRVLDLCAAPGGKATALAAKLQGKGLLVANDISASRAKALLKNLEVSGVKNAFVTNAAPAKLAEQFPLFFDRILVDAPCSGEGMFRKDSSCAKAWSPEKVETCAKLQRSILREAVAMLRSGGMLLYSTCTFAPEEDEQAVAYLLREFPGMELCEVPWYEGFSHGMPELGDESRWKDMLSGCPRHIGREDAGMAEEPCRKEDGERLGELRKCVRIFPHKMGGEGHFLALFCKQQEDSEIPDRILGERQGGSRREVQDRTCGERQGRSRREIQDRILGERQGRTCGEIPDRIRGGRQGRSRREMQDKSRREVQGSAHAPAKAEWEILEGFFRDIRMEYDKNRIEVRSGQAYLVPEQMPAVKGIPFLRNGLYLGEIRKGRFEPSQSLAMALSREEYTSVIDFDSGDERVFRYLRGETVQAGDKTPGRLGGWQLVCVDGYPIGWGKLVDGTLKNKYHSGWRIK